MLVQAWHETDAHDDSIAACPRRGNRSFNPLCALGAPPRSIARVTIARGLSSPMVNVLWGLANLSVAYVLLVIVADVAPGPSVHTGIAALGFALASVGIARSASRVSSA